MSNRLRYLSLLTTLLIVANLHAQETCSEEVKLLLSPPQVQSAITALKSLRDNRSNALYQGLALVGPQRIEKRLGFSPC